MVSVWGELLGPLGAQLGCALGVPAPGGPGARRLTDGSPSLEDDAGRVEELQELLEKQNFELSQARERLVSLTASVAELEEDLGTARRDLIRSEEQSSKHQRDLREVRGGPPARPHLLRRRWAGGLLACPGCAARARPGRPAGATVGRSSERAGSSSGPGGGHGGR